MDTRTEDRTFTTQEVMEATGASYRIVDYWARNGVLTPSVAEACGSGSRRRFSALDVEVARVLLVLGAHGATGPSLRPAAEGLRQVLADEGLTGVVYITVGGQVSRMVLGAGWAVDLDAIGA